MYVFKPNLTSRVYHNFTSNNRGSLSFNNHPTMRIPRWIRTDLFICCLVMLVPIVLLDQTQLESNLLNLSDPETAGTPTLCSIFEPGPLIDELLVGSLHVLEGPLALPRVEWRGGRLRKGKAYGLDSIRRAGIAESICKGDLVIVRSIFNNTKPIKGNYEWEKLGILDGTAELTVTDLLMAMTFRLHLAGSRPTIDFVDIVRLSGVTVELTGLGPFSPLLGGLSSRIANRFQSQIASAVEGVTLKFLNVVVLRKLLEGR